MTENRFTRSAAMSDRLAEARRESPEVDAVMSAYEELEQMYRASLIAMGQVVESDLAVGNSADVQVELQYSVLTTDHPGA